MDSFPRVTMEKGLEILAIDENGMATTETTDVIYQEVLEHLLCT
jgi:hypothetical protein